MKYYPVILLSLLALSCADSTNPNIKPTKTNKTKTATDNTTANSESNKSNMKNQIKTFLTFQDNNAENAMNFYVELFPNSKVTDLQRWGKGAPGEEGKIMFATFELNGSPFMCSDSPPIHDWNFSPAVSNYLDCDNEEELEIHNTGLLKAYDRKPAYTYKSKSGWHTLIQPFNMTKCSKEFQALVHKNALMLWAY